jgi:hypothetical protein
MKKLIIALPFVFCVLLISSCKKQQELRPNSPSSGIGATIHSLFGAPLDPDFFVFISSSYNKAPTDTRSFKLNSTSLVVQAGSLDGSNVGVLQVANSVIPASENGFYVKQITDTTEVPSFFGSNLTFSLDGNGFPGFQYNACSPMPVELSFDGLQANEVVLSSGFTVNWEPEVSCEELLSYVIVFGSEAGVRKQKVFAVSDETGTLTVQGHDLSDFEGFEFIDVCYARGYYQEHVIQDKTIQLQFLTTSYAVIMIAQ